MTRITLADRRFKIDQRRIKKLIDKLLGAENNDDKNVDIIYCTDVLITDLNSRFLNRNRVTDVIAFNLEDDNNGDFLGEVYVNVQQAGRQARERGIDVGEEVERLTIHGVLHLLGYDDGDNAGREKMWELQESYLSKWKK